MLDELKVKDLEKVLLRTKNARLADLLTGAYHFNTGDTPQGQVNHFFDVVQPDTGRRGVVRAVHHHGHRVPSPGGALTATY